MAISKIFPQKLRRGDEVRVISPANSMSIITPSVRSIATSRLQEMGLHVTFSKHCEERDVFDSSPVQSRLDDIHEAFSDSNVKGILTTIGGYNSIQLLKNLDYSLIRNNPKIVCGYSDITTLQNAIFAKTGLVTYSGPHFSTFGCIKMMDYVIDSFRNCLFEGAATVSLDASSQWSDDAWYLDQEKRTFIPNDGYVVLQSGEVSGTIVGGNIGSFALLQGTEFMPSLKDAVLFLEDNYPMTVEVFDRHLHSLILQRDFEQVKGIVIGRFQVESKISTELLQRVIDTKAELKGIPVVAGADFGHTLPMFTFPVGGEIKVEAGPFGVKLGLMKK